MLCHTHLGVLFWCVKRSKSVDVSFKKCINLEIIMLLKVFISFQVFLKCIFLSYLKKTCRIFICIVGAYTNIHVYVYTWQLCSRIVIIITELTSRLNKKNWRYLFVILIDRRHFSTSKHIFCFDGQYFKCNIKYLSVSPLVKLFACSKV